MAIHANPATEAMSKKTNDNKSTNEGNVEHKGDKHNSNKSSARHRHASKGNVNADGNTAVEA